jgi:uncharacterized protein YdhG (YjbR/CyaY superfamily)
MKPADGDRDGGEASIDAYIRLQPREVQRTLSRMRTLIHRAAPEAAEKMAYRMPTFHLNGNLVHFAAHTGHIGFYPTPGAITKFKRELAKYVTSKGAIQFPLDEPLPAALITRIVRFRRTQALGKQKK